MEYVAALVLATVLVLANGCTKDLGEWVRRDPNGQEYDEMKVYFSEVVIFGQVAGITDSNIAGVKNAMVDVICSYKGNIQTKRINVYGIGNKMGQIPGCPKANLKQDEKAVMFLKKLPERRGKPWFEIEFAPVRGESSVIVDDLTMVCGLTRTFGGEVLENGECYEPIEEGDCEQYVLPTAPPSTEAPTTQKPVKEITEVVVEPNDDAAKEEPDTTGGDKQNDDKNAYNTNPGKTSDTAESKDNKGNAASHVSISCVIVMLSALALTIV